jgi:polar amino acid transport system substrate-binding protein
VIDQGAGKQPTGASVEYREKYIAPKLGVKTEWVGPFPMLRLLKSLEDGEIDAIIVMAKNPDREK